MALLSLEIFTHERMGLYILFIDLQDSVFTQLKMAVYKREASRYKRCISTA